MSRSIAKTLTIIGKNETLYHELAMNFVQFVHYLASNHTINVDMIHDGIPASIIFKNITALLTEGGVDSKTAIMMNASSFMPVCIIYMIQLVC